MDLTMTAPSPTTSPTTPPGAISRPSGEVPVSPLTRRGHLWRLLVAAVIGMLVLVSTGEQLPEPWTTRTGVVMALDVLLLGPLALGLLLLHRRRPMPVAVAVTLLTAVSALAAGAGLLCLVSVATRRRWREIVPLAVLAAVCGLVFEVVYPRPDDPTELLLMGPIIALMVVGAVAWGMYLGARRELVESWRLRAESADRERLLASEHAREAERARIAREMHDVLAHRLSLLSLHAGALAYREDLPLEEARREARIVQRTAREALEELRAVLGLLRDDGPDGPREPPQPGLADLPALLEQARTAGPVHHEPFAAPAAAPPERLGRHAYRIVQEALTNARRHAPGAPVTVSVTGAPGGDLVVEVRNAAPATPAAVRSHGAGVGLVGLSERVHLVGGSMTAGPTPDGGFTLIARLPWPAQTGEGPGERADG